MAAQYENAEWNGKHVDILGGTFFSCGRNDGVEQPRACLLALRYQSGSCSLPVCGSLSSLSLINLRAVYLFFCAMYAVMSESMHVLMYSVVTAGSWFRAFLCPFPQRVSRHGEATAIECTGTINFIHLVLWGHAYLGASVDVAKLGLHLHNKRVYVCTQISRVRLYKQSITKARTSYMGAKIDTRRVRASVMAEMMHAFPV